MTYLGLGAGLIVGGVALVAGACGDECAPGTRSIAGQCRPLGDLADGGLDTADASILASCGDGQLDEGEACDDANRAEADGCEPGCALTAGWSCKGVRCERLPEGMPVITGVPSSDPEHVLWVWTVPLDAADVQVTIDDGSVKPEVQGNSARAAGLSEGPHTISVAACNAIGGCGEPATHTTRVKRFGPASRPWYRGVERTFTRPILGGPDAMTGLGCDGCFLGPAGEIVPLETALPSIATSLTRGADVIELEVSLIGQALHVSPGDEFTVGDRPSLEALLESPILVTSLAPLFLQVREEGPAEEFAATLLELLEAHPQFARNGRPLFVRAAIDKTNYLSALREGAREHPFIEPYLRYWVTIPPDEASWRNAVDATAQSHYHGVTFDFRAPELFARIGVAHARELGVWIDGVPGPGHGEIPLAALRESVDGFSTVYRIDRAGAVVEAADSLAFFDASPLVTPADPLPIHYVRASSGAPGSWERVLQVPATDELFGSPDLAWWSDDQPLAGGVLDFSVGDRAMRFTEGVLDPLPDGLLVSLVTTLGDLDLIEPGSFSSLLGSDSRSLTEDPGGFVLTLKRSAQSGALSLQWAVYVGDRYHIFEYPAAGGSSSACESLNGAFTAPLKENQAYWFVGFYDGDGPVQLFIDGKCAGAVAPVAVGPVAATPLTLLVGAQPATARPLGVNFFRGQMQVGQLLSWPSHEADGTN
jgi:cysteine-rich repeat protein